MGSMLCPETANLEPGQCERGKHASKNQVVACTNEHCTEKPTVCDKCGFPSKADPKKLLCKLCHIGDD